MTFFNKVSIIFTRKFLIKLCFSDYISPTHFGKNGEWYKATREHSFDAEHKQKESKDAEFNVLQKCKIICFWAPFLQNMFKPRNFGWIKNRNMRYEGISDNHWWKIRSKIIFFGYMLVKRLSIDMTLHYKRLRDVVLILTDFKKASPSICAAHLVFSAKSRIKNNSIISFLVLLTKLQKGQLRTSMYEYTNN